MRVVTLFVRVAVFFIALASSVFITRLYQLATVKPLLPPSAVSIEKCADSHARAPETKNRTSISFKPQLITLDFGTRKSHALLSLEHDSLLPAPEKLWVTTHFFTKGEAGDVRVSCSVNAVETWRPFAGGNRAHVTATAPITTCREPLDPAATYYASVNVSTEQVECTSYFASPNQDLATLTPVVLERSAGAGR